MIEWEFRCSVSYPHLHALVYRSFFGGRGVQKEIISHVNLEGDGFAKVDLYYFVDNTLNTFKTEDELKKFITEEQTDVLQY